MKKLFNLFWRPALNTLAPSRPEPPPIPPKQFDTAKEKAEKLVGKFYFCHSTITKDLAKKLAQITVDEIENELIEFGEWSHELQNMEQEFRHLNNVREEIRSL